MRIELNKKVVELLNKLTEKSNFNYPTEKQINTFLEICLTEELRRW